MTIEKQIQRMWWIELFQKNVLFLTKDVFMIVWEPVWVYVHHGNTGDYRSQRTLVGLSTSLMITIQASFPALSRLSHPMESQLFWSQVLRSGSLTFTSPESDILFCPGKIQGFLSPVCCRRHMGGGVSALLLSISLRWLTCSPNLYLIYKVEGQI